MLADNLPVLLFNTIPAWEEWLQTHEDAPGIWVQFAKKNSGTTSISYLQALESALCYGWIDSQVKKYDEATYIQKFTPRRVKSIWSKINIERAERLIQEGRMTSAGQQEIDAAKKDGRWAQAYDSPSTSTVPADFLKTLSAHPKAEAFFHTLNKSNRYAIAWRLQTAKTPETRNRRITAIIAMLDKGEAFH